MAAKILKPEIKASGIMDAMEMGVFKTISERAFVPVVGNSSFTSGTAKLVIGGIASKLSRNKHVNLLSSAIVMDATEDFAHALMAKLGTGTAGTAANDGW